MATWQEDWLKMVCEKYDRQMDALKGDAQLYRTRRRIRVKESREGDGISPLMAIRIAKRIISIAAIQEKCAVWRRVAGASSWSAAQLGGNRETWSSEEFA